MKFKFKKFLWFFTVIILLLLIAVIGIVLYLPEYIENSIIPQIAKNCNIEKISCNVKSIGMHNSEFSDISLGKRDNDLVSIDSISVNYSPKSLINRHIEKIVISGAEINIQYKDGKFILPGLNLDNFKNINQKVHVDAIDSKKKYLPISLESFEIQTGLLNLRYQNDFYKIPFNLKIKNITRNQEKIECELNIEFPDINLTENEFKITMPKTTATAKLIYSNKNSISTVECSFKTKIKNISFNTDKLNLSVSNLAVSIPFKLPYNTAAKEGHISIDEIFFQDKNIGTLNALLKQKNMGMEYKAEFDSVLIPNLKIKLNGGSYFDKIKGSTSELNFAVNDYEIKNIKSLKELFPVLKKVDITGALNVNGKAGFNSGKLQSTLNIRLKDVDFGIPEKNFSANGIDLNLNFPDIIKFKTDPQQTLTFDKISFNNILIKKGITDFQIESLKSFFVERGIYEWCEGHIYIQPFRIRPDVPEYNILLFCDRLNLAQLLAQTGILKAEGEGMLNGYIPILINKKGIFFKDGALYSFPGKTGTIKLSNTELLTAGLPKNSPQYHQLEFARQALSNFKYDWCKLNFNSQGTQCVLNMTLFGKPSKPLPFVYNKDLQQYTEVETKGSIGVLRPIQIDLNFLIPINQVLEYGSGINKLIDDFSQ